MIIIFLVIIDVELDDTKNTNDSQFSDDMNNADVIDYRISDNFPGFLDDMNDTNDSYVIDSRLSDDTSDTNGADTDVIDSQNSDNFPGFGT